MSPGKSLRENLKKLLNWNAEEIMLAGIVIVGVVSITAFCLLTPVKQFVVKPIEAVLGKTKKGDGKSKAKSEGGPGEANSENGEGSGFWTGIFSMGNIQMSLGRKGEYVDSEMNIEYNGHLLNIRSDGKVKDEESGNNYLRKSEGKLKDAMVMRSSEFTGVDVNKRDGLGEFKNEMVMALNRQFDDTSIVTNIYFRRFVLYSEELQADEAETD